MALSEPDGAYLMQKIRSRCVDDAGCMVWQGYCNKRGSVPVINIDGTPQTVRRLVYALEVGPIRPDYEVVPTCETLRCVSPEHMKQVSKADRRRLIAQNQRGASAARIAANRERQGKLTMEKAREIRASEATGLELAERFGVTPQLISLVRTGKSWAEPSPWNGLGARG